MRTRGNRIETVAMDAKQGEAARGAFRRFGRGRHAAGLNIGDRCSGEPLLSASIE